MANIIRAAALESRRIDGAVYDARVEAARIVAEARAAAAELVGAAHRDCERLREAARRLGREEGVAEALATIARAAEERDGLLASAEPELVRLAGGIASAVLRREAEQGAAVVVEMTRRALTEARHRACVTVRIHPSELEVVRAGECELARITPRCPAIAWVADAAIERGGVVVETENGSIDASLGSQLATVVAALHGTDA